MNAYTQMGYGDQATWGGRMPYDDAAEDFDEAVYAKAKELMTDDEEFCPQYLNNILLALNDLFESGNQAEIDALELALTNKDTQAFKLIGDIAHNYCAKEAEDYARKILKQ